MLSGMFGVGGGFLMTPLLIFIGVPPAVAVGTEANQVVAASVSGALAHWRRGNVDFKMGFILLKWDWVIMKRLISCKKNAFRNSPKLDFIKDSGHQF